ncbi:MAG: membrane dipeptidase [Actinobacteria bacterium]|nr:membrane dipeptidase [Actinomycetota bacterium]
MIVDLHSDVVADVVARREAGEEAVLARRHLPAWRAGDCVAAVCVVGTDVELVASLREGSPFDAALAYLDALAADVAEADGAIAVVRSPADLEAAIAAGTFAIVPSMEGASPIGSDLGRLRELHARGVRVFGLTWNSRNDVAAGVGFDGGLTDFGAEAVASMHGLGVVVDLAHASVETYWDVVERTEAPLLVSHANARALCDHERNLDDEQLAALRRLGGVIGVVLYPPYVGAANPTLADVGAHLTHMADLVGPQGVGIGADFMAYFDRGLLLDIFPDEDGAVPPFPGGIEDPSGLPLLLGELQRRGVDAETVAGVAGDNFRRLWGEVAGGG